MKLAGHRVQINFWKSKYLGRKQDTQPVAVAKGLLLGQTHFLEVRSKVIPPAQLRHCVVVASK